MYNHPKDFFFLIAMALNGRWLMWFWLSIILKGILCEDTSRDSQKNQIMESKLTMKMNDKHVCLSLTVTVVSVSHVSSAIQELSKL